jgi:hypothetical protein
MAGHEHAWQTGETAVCSLCHYSRDWVLPVPFVLCGGPWRCRCPSMHTLQPRAPKRSEYSAVDCTSVLPDVASVLSDAFGTRTRP